MVRNLESAENRDDGAAPLPPGSPWLNTSEVATHLGVSPRTIRPWLAEGLIPHVRLPGRFVRFDRDAIDAWARSFAAQQLSPVRKGPRRR